MFSVCRWIKLIKNITSVFSRESLQFLGCCQGSMEWINSMFLFKTHLETPIQLRPWGWNGLALASRCQQEVSVILNDIVHSIATILCIKVYFLNEWGCFLISLQPKAKDSRNYLSCLQTKAKDLGITWVVALLVGFFVT